MLMVLNRNRIQNQNYILETDKRTERKHAHPKRVNERINIETLYPFWSFCEVNRILYLLFNYGSASSLLFIVY